MSFRKSSASTRSGAPALRLTKHMQCEFARTRTTTFVLLLCAASGISPQANAADLAAYRRSDGDSSVVYRELDNDIHEIYLCAVNDSECRKGGDYHSWDPSALTGAPPAAGDPAAYVRWDDLNSMVYRGSDNHIHELTTPGGSIWQTADLSALADAPPAAGDPAAYRRYDVVNSVVYRGLDDHIHELYLAPGGSWQAEDLSALADAPPAAGDPAAYIRWDNVNSVVYRGLDNDVHELYLAPDGSGWQTADLSALTGAPLASDPNTGIATLRKAH